jgi:hypothetical protein
MSLVDIIVWHSLKMDNLSMIAVVRFFFTGVVNVICIYCYVNYKQERQNRMINLLQENVEIKSHYTNGIFKKSKELNFVNAMI